MLLYWKGALRSKDFLVNRGAIFFQLQLEKSQGDSGEFDAPSSNGDDSDDDEANRHSPTEEDEAQDSPGPAVTPKEFDPDVSFS